jgi:hypothetical protein
MFEENEGPVETATSFADAFVDAGVAKLDAVFGAGYAKGNPQVLAGYLAACASNLNAFMTAAAAVGDGNMFDEALVALEEEYPTAPPPRPKGRRR